MKYYIETVRERTFVSEVEAENNHHALVIYFRTEIESDEYVCVWGGRFNAPQQSILTITYPNGQEESYVAVLMFPDPPINVNKLQQQGDKQ